MRERSDGDQKLQVEMGAEGLRYSPEGLQGQGRSWMWERRKTMLHGVEQLDQQCLSKGERFTENQISGGE